MPILLFEDIGTLIGHLWKVSIQFMQKLLRKLRTIHLHVNLNHCVLSPKGAIIHTLINSDLFFLLCIIGLMIRNVFEKFQYNTKPVVT